jgi:O-antigen ligase
MTNPTVSSSDSEWTDWLTKIALVVATVLVSVRITTLEVVRDTFDLGSAGAGISAPAATTTLILDLLCWVPTLLILVRRAIDPRYTLRLHQSHLWMVLLALWVACSGFWADDKFQAVINISTWCAAMSLAWALCQLVRSWTRFRMVMALTIGFCIIFVSQAAIYRWIEWPETKRDWDTLKPLVMQARNWTENDFGFQQFERKVLAGELVGFYRSPNTYAAVAAMTLIIAGAFAMQRYRDQPNEPLFPVLIGVPVLACVAVVWLTQSRTALVGLAGCLLLFGMCWWKRDLLTRRSKLFFGIGLIVVVLGLVAVLCIGLSTGGLLHDSLSFRWNYWVASWKLFLDNKLLGVGWGSFGNAYLAYRLPVATEEIKDPHNLFVKFATETGVIGLGLVIAWLLRSAQEITRPIVPKTVLQTRQPVGYWLVIVPLGFLILRVIVYWPESLLLPEMPKLLLFSLGLGFGMLIGIVRSRIDLTADDRSAWLILLGSLVALAGFLLHAMVDFAFFENGPLVLMMLILGSVLGVRHPGAAGKPSKTGWALVSLGVVFCGLMTFLALLVIPISSAEAKWGRARNLINEQRYSAAIVELREALVTTPVPNSEYARQCAKAMILSQQTDPQEILSMLTEAITANPADPLSWLERARFRRAVAPSFTTDVNAISSDYFQSVSRNPTDVRTRIEYADFLWQVGKNTEARIEYEKAMKLNQMLQEDEPRRLRQDEIDVIRHRLK